MHDYIAVILGREWGVQEFLKPLEERHQIITLFEKARNFQKDHISQDGKLYGRVATAPVSAYLQMAYDLYMLKHNVGLQQLMIERLKNKDSFQGVRYELYVVAILIKAGFSIEYEDERDNTRQHCEYTATYTETGKKFSVEVKSKHRVGIWGHYYKKQKNSLNLNINRLIKNAIDKETMYQKVIFIDVNLPSEPGDIFDKSWVKQSMNTLNKVEAKPYAKGKTAYIFMTNAPHGHCKDHDIDPGSEFYMSAIGIDDFLVNDEETARTKHREICRLADFLAFHTEIPHEFEDIKQGVSIVRNETL